MSFEENSSKYSNLIEEQIAKDEELKISAFEPFISKSDLISSPQDFCNFEFCDNLASESMSNSYLLTQFPSSSLNANTLTSTGSSTTSSLNPISPSSSGSSLTFPLDFNTSNNFLIGNNFLNIYDSNLNANHSYSTPMWPNDEFNFKYIENRKHDVSCGTEFSTQNDSKTKKELQWTQSLKLPIVDRKTSVTNNKPCTNINITTNVLPTFYTSNNNTINLNGKQPSSESFRLVEKIQPKKSRTKYTKDQLGYLESAFAHGSYPDLNLVESLCKTLEISKEKINIWFQNRRARSKRGGSKIKNLNTNNISFISNNADNQLASSRLITINPVDNNIQSNSFASSPASQNY